MARLTATGATEVTVGGHIIAATLPTGTTGTAVFAMTDVPGWRCTAPVKSFHGLVSMGIPTGTTPEGLTPGLAAATLALLALAPANGHGPAPRAPPG